MSHSIIPFYKSSSKQIEKSFGCYQYDSEGKEYIDFESGVWCANLGHSNEKIVAVFNEQSKKSIHHGYRFRNKKSEELSDELQRIIGFDNGASVFLSSGSEAVNLAIAIAQKITCRKRILKISNSYLSAYGIGQIDPNNENLINVGFNDLAHIESINFEEIAAFVIETGGASLEMVKFPNIEFVRKLVESAQRKECIIIAEEVTTGMGRLGKWFGFQNYDILPDIVVTGKALGNGYPISAVTVNSVVLQILNKELFTYAQSHQNDPLGCAIGLEVIKVIEEEKILKNCIRIGEYFKERLFILKENNPLKIKEIRGKGLMLALEFQDSFDGEKLNERLFESGFVFGHKNNTLRFLPPLIITETEVDKLILKLEELI
jgi:acetylornithine aminotransferase